MAATYQDDLPEYYWPKGGGNWMEITSRLLNDPANIWWDNQNTPKIEKRDEILASAFKAAVDEIDAIAGKDPANWAWGDVHGTTFKNQVMNNLPFIRDVFNRGPFPSAGGGGIINANSWSSLDSYETRSLVSERVIMDLSDWDQSVWINTTGQSGHAYHPHYIDMADSWRLVKYVPQYWELPSIKANTEGHLRLMP
jgi:penicillin amidase